MDGGWLASVVVLASFAVTMTVLELMTRGLSPPPERDPRLGTVMFWAWVAVIAAVTYAIAPYMDAARPLDSLLEAAGLLGWLAWKLGINESWEDTPRDREQIWATTIGVLVALVAREVLSG
jgi:hypothetical protein